MDVEPPVYRNETRSLSIHGNEDITIYNGIWGGWKHWRKTQSSGMYACGAELRFEDSQGGGDDTAANGLKLKYCGLSDWYVQEEQEIWGGNWGGWKGWQMCPYGKYIGAGNVRFEDSQGGGDDTALNGLAIYCVDKDWRNGEVKIVYYGKWGGWKGWSYRANKLVKGARVRYEDSIGRGDDTAMNGIQFNVEKPNFGVSRSQITGEWVPVASGPQGHITHKIIESTERRKLTASRSQFLPASKSRLLTSLFQYQHHRVVGLLEQCKSLFESPGQQKRRWDAQAQALPLDITPCGSLKCRSQQILQELDLGLRPSTFGVHHLLNKYQDVHLVLVKTGCASSVGTKQYSILSNINFK